MHGIHPSFETQDRRHQKFKTWVSEASQNKKKTCVLPKLLNEAVKLHQWWLQAQQVNKQYS